MRKVRAIRNFQFDWIFDILQQVFQSVKDFPTLSVELLVRRENPNINKSYLFLLGMNAFVREAGRKKYQATDVHDFAEKGENRCKFAQGCRQCGPTLSASAGENKHSRAGLLEAAVLAREGLHESCTAM